MAKNQEELWREDFVELLRTSKPVQYFVQSLVEDTGLYDLAPNDPIAIARFEGRRDVGINLKAILDDVDPQIFHQLMFARQVFLSENNNSSEEGTD